MKKKDIYVIVSCLLIVGLMYGLWMLFSSEKDMVYVYYQNEEVLHFDLQKDAVYEIEGSYGMFHIEVKDGAYHAVNVDCPNHDCEKVGWVKKNEATPIICVPNEIFVVQKKE